MKFFLIISCIDRLYQNSIIDVYLSPQGDRPSNSLVWGCLCDRKNETCVDPIEISFVEIQRHTKPTRMLQYT